MLHNNDLVVDMNDSDGGACIADIRTSGPAFVDDLAITTVLKTTLNRKLNTAWEHGRKWRYEYHPKKTEVTIHGKDECPDIPVVMGDNTVDAVLQHKHVGVTICTDIKAEETCIEERASAARRIQLAAQGIGSGRQRLAPDTLSRLYCATSIPKLTYGLNLRPLSNTSVDTLDSAHWAAAKRIQGLPSQTSNAACLAPLGWLSVKAQLDVSAMDCDLQVCDSDKTALSLHGH